MNQEQIQGNWQQFKGKIKENWGKLTDDDIQQSKGNMEALIGKITKSYGLSKEAASEKIEEIKRSLAANGVSASIASNTMEMVDTVNEKIHSAAKCCGEFVKDKPLTTVAIVAAAGLILGTLLSRKS